MALKWAGLALGAVGGGLLVRRLSTPAPACRPVVLCGPSGAGKSSLIHKLTAEFPDDFGFSVSHTTRKPRKGEEDGVDYHFVAKPDMEAAIAKGGEFLETAHVHANIYGTSKRAVSDVADRCRVCVLDIDVQGVQTCKAINFEAGKYIFVAPPSIDALRERLTARGTETSESMERRLRNAAGELEAAKTIDFDATIVNDDLDHAYAVLRKEMMPIIEECRKCRAATPACAAGAGGGAKR
uniref:guanylate kinase n=1 Tax=Bicosoecida sp. CB-2014 TaxID=1486930 RepID=A0A7S1C324_9STRA|eukprot:CAMPEP_0203809740 /NCGR_PEP_ID=MMETSP0115-20131106/2496_1 /ASSEMBLY_ACC=CAM_ASM_000227 /TAXON_ID=33651 /ORGANISM="Bicosoecid sp, Strain ms1" /LENGTH=238 /DNA_ID=CAMNT_0050718495 /DNA_START=78 /DNA_END=794 /DNA_ORIENTATION=-